MYKLYLVKDTIKKMLMYIDAECLISFKILWHALSNICLGPRGVEKAVKIQRTKLPITIRCMISQHLRNGAPRWPWPLTHGRKTGIKRESSDRSIKGTCRILHVGYFLSTQGYFSFKNSQVVYPQKLSSLCFILHMYMDTTALSSNYLKNSIH